MPEIVIRNLYYLFILSMCFFLSRNQSNLFDITLSLK